MTLNEREAFEALPDIKEKLNTVYFNESLNSYFAAMINSGPTVKYVQGAWMAWQAKAQAVPEWISVEDRLPEAHEFVLVKTKSNYAQYIVAHYIPKFTVTDGADDEFGDYCEEKDDWFLPQGWYANVSPVSDEYMGYFIDEDVTQWTYLQEASESGAEG